MGRGREVAEIPRMGDEPVARRPTKGLAKLFSRVKETMGQCYGVPNVGSSKQVVEKITESDEMGESQKSLSKRNQFKKRVAVAANAISSDSGITIPNHPKRTETLRLLERAVEDNLLFKHLSLPAKVAIFKSMAPMTVKAGTVLIKQGDPDANKFYVLQSGTCDVLQDDLNGRDRVVHTCTAGSTFGELALLYASPRAATVIASSECQLWVMERDVYNAISASFRKKQQEEKWALMDKVSALSMLSHQEKMMLVDSLELKEFGDKDIICVKGEPGDTFYLISDGCVSVKAKGQEVAYLKAGDFFGERSLIVDEPRSADVVADGYVVCHTLSRQVFKELLGAREELWKFGCLRKVPVLSMLSNEQIWQLLQHMETQSFDRGEFVFQKGEKGETFYIVNNGVFRIFDDDKTLTEITSGSCFGELALLSNNVRSAHVMALDSNCEVMKLHRDVFTFLLGSLESIKSVWRYEALRTVPLFSPLNNQQLTRIAQAMEEETYGMGEDIIRQGENGDKFYVIQQGEVMIVNGSGKELARKGPKDYVGELALLKNEPRAASVRTVSPTTVLSLNRKQFDEQMGPLKSVLIEFASSNYCDGKLGTLSAPLSLSDVHTICVLGQGAFGKVALVRYLGRQYALKQLWKSHVIKMGVQEHVKREAKILMSCKNDFLVNLVATGKSEDKLFMLMNPVLGGELFTYLRKRKVPLPENEARFYVACVIQALEYLQVNHIAYRDLKPENLLIDKDGYLKLADFGFAKKVRTGRTYTLCGTPDYLAPELVLQTGHNYGVDWWALGVLIFEVVNGYPPFYDDDKVTMYKNITELRYHLTRRMSKECKDLVKKLLNKNPTLRLGMGRAGATAVKAHPWFQGFDWHRLATKSMTAPYIPQVNHEEDASNFDLIQDDHDEPRKRYVSTGVFSDF